MADKQLIFTPPPTLSKFMQSDAFGRLVAGPVGSGKTYAMIVEMLRRMIAQEPGQDGLRHSHWAILRQTLAQIKATILPDLERMLQGVSNYRVSESAIRIWFGDVRAVIYLIPLESIEDQRRLLSLQLTGAWISECIEIGVDLIGPISGRIGRYPSGTHGTPSWRGIICDTNFPVEGGDWWSFMESPPSIWSVFKQPSGLSLEAENLHWLNQTEKTLKLPEDHPDRIRAGREYYLRLVAGSSESFIQRYVRAEYGPDPSGAAVYRSTFHRHFHVQDNVEPVASKLLVIGQDFGRNPCAVITQLDHQGRLLVLEEIISNEMGLERHLKENLRPALSKPQYAGKPVVVIGDPAGGARSSLFEINEFDLLKSHGFAAFPAPSNSPETRIQAVESFLQAQRGGGPAIIFDSRCKMLITGAQGGYRFAKLQGGELKPKPDKNSYSHIQDALQYAALVAGSGGAYGRASSLVSMRSKPRQPAPSVLAWT